MVDFLRVAPPIEPYGKQNGGMILSEGAGQSFSHVTSRIRIECAHPGGYFSRRAEAEELLKHILRDLGQTEIDFVISSANGTFIDAAESHALQEASPKCAGVHRQAGLGRKRWRGRIVAGHSRG